jgi:hypothetical protein
MVEQLRQGVRLRQPSGQRFSILANRSRDSFHDWQDERRSPPTVLAGGMTAESHPRLWLRRDGETGVVTAFASADGETWEFAGRLITSFARSFRAGVTAAGSGEFDGVEVVGTALGALLPYVRQAGDDDQVILAWSKPRNVAAFEALRTTDRATAAGDLADRPCRTCRPPTPLRWGP